MDLNKPTNQILVWGDPLRDTYQAETGAIEIGRIVKVGSAHGKVTKTTTDDVVALGIADRDKRKAMTGSYAIDGYLPVILKGSGAVVVLTAGAAVAEGERVKPGLDGKLVPILAADSPGVVVAIALELASGDLETFMGVLI